MHKTKQPFRPAGRRPRAALLAAAALACCCSYAVAQNTSPDAAPDANASADTIMTLVADASSCAANPAACAAQVYAGHGIGGYGARPNSQ
ncbi:hypothetical protein FH729_24100, partial [Bacteroides thetaiotaomicron]|nr:hypothetical protein [Bacteroides thetaiotaomicron]